MVSAQPATARSRRTRSALTMAVHRVVAAHGEIIVDEIVELAGVSPATFYGHFENHDDALAAALDTSLNSVVAVAEEVFTIEKMLSVGLETTVDRLVIETHRVFSAETAVIRAALSRLGGNPLIADTYRLHERRSHDHLARHIELGQRAQLVRTGDHTARATSLLVVLQGMNNPMLLKDELPAPLRGDLVRIILALLR